MVSTVNGETSYLYGFGSHNFVCDATEAALYFYLHEPLKQFAQSCLNARPTAWFCGRGRCPGGVPQPSLAADNGLPQQRERAVKSCESPPRAALRLNRMIG